MNNTYGNSISKAVILDFSDGVKTIYTRSTQINIAFEVEYIRVANTYLSVNGAAGAEMNAIITSNLVDNDVISSVRQYTSTKPLKHYYEIPRPINGSYDFSISLSNTLATLITTSRVGYELVGTIGIGTDEIVLNTITSNDVFFLSFVEDDFESPPGRLIKTGVGPYVLGTNSFNIISYDSATQIIQTSQLAAGTLTGVNWFMDGNLLTITVGYDNINVGSFSDDFIPRITITKKFASVGRYRIDSVATYLPLDPADNFSTPGIFNFYDLTQCQVLLDLEFYQKIAIPRVIQNTQYYLWNSNNFSDIKNIDVLFPVDEIRIVNFNVIQDTPLLTIVGFSSDLVQSSILSSENYLSFNSIQSGNYQINKKKYIFNQQRIINGAYRINANYMLTGLPFDITAVNGEFYFHILFIRYKV